MFKIEDRSISRDSPPYVIAEVSANHGGSIEKAIKTIHAANEMGASAVKIQTYTPETMTIDSQLDDFIVKGGPWDGRKLYDLYREAHTPYAWHPELFQEARSLGVTLFSTPFDETAVELLESLDCPAYKVASFELTDLPLLRLIGSLGKPVLMSTGMAIQVQIDEAVEALRGAGCQELLLFHCISSYPAPIEQANLSVIKTLIERYEVEVGLSDHTIGETAAAIAVSMGATAIEKHFTLDRSEKGPDSDFSIEPNELRSLVRSTRDAWAAVGDGSLSKRSPAEQKSTVFRRSIYFVKDMVPGQVIGATDIRRIRPGFGLPPKHFAELVGRKVNRAVAAGTPVGWDLVE